MAASKAFYTKQKKMWNGWSRHKQLAHMRKYPRSVFKKRYGIKSRPAMK